MRPIEHQVLRLRQDTLFGAYEVMPRSATQVNAEEEVKKGEKKQNLIAAFAT